MKVRQILSFIVLVLLIIMPLLIVKGYAPDKINVLANGQYVNFETQGPVIVDGRVLIPVRGVFEALGFDVSWNPSNREVTLLDEHDNVVIITIYSDVFLVNGDRAFLDVPAQIIGGSTMLPIRAVMAPFPYYVDWDGERRTVILTPMVPSIVSFHEGTMFLREVYFEDLDAPMERFRFYHNSQGDVFAEHNIEEDPMPQLFNVRLCPRTGRIEFVPINPFHRSLFHFALVDGTDGNWIAMRHTYIGIAEHNPEKWYNIYWNRAIIERFRELSWNDTITEKYEQGLLDLKDVFVSFVHFEGWVYWYRWLNESFGNLFGYEVPDNLLNEELVIFENTMGALKKQLGIR